LIQKPEYKKTTDIILRKYIQYDSVFDSFSFEDLPKVPFDIELLQHVREMYKNSESRFWSLSLVAGFTTENQEWRNALKNYIEIIERDIRKYNDQELDVALRTMENYRIDNIIEILRKIQGRMTYSVKYMKMLQTYGDKKDIPYLFKYRLDDLDEETGHGIEGVYRQRNLAYETIERILNTKLPHKQITDISKGKPVNYWSWVPLDQFLEQNK
jgi:hypothetical protein